MLTAAVPFAILLALLLAGSGSSPEPEPKPGPDPEPGPGPEPDPGDLPPIINEAKWSGLIPPPDDESMLDDLSDEDIIDAACAIWGSRKPGDSDSALALRALKGLFPGLAWPGTPGGQRALAQQRFAEQFALIRSGQLVCDAPITPIYTPTAGGYYQIQKGDNLFGIVQEAYPGLNAQQRVQAAKTVINHPKNGGGKVGNGIIVATTTQGNKNLLGDAIVSFYAKWRCNPTTEFARYDQGTCYAVVYLPLI